MIGALLPGALEFEGGAATKRALVNLHAPRVLHVATHGFFLADAPTPAPRADPGLILATRSRANRVDSPLLRSGIALAGANLHREDGDGILTALEVSALDLWGTKLVVLSACETGLGDVTNGEGVYGLRRAIVLAGAESEVMSLWKVNDAATRDLMVAYYTALNGGGGRTEALREAQLAMAATKDRGHPYYWAAFIASGDWRSLSGVDVPIARATLQTDFGRVEPSACGCRVAGNRNATAPMMASLVVTSIAAARLRRRRRLARCATGLRIGSRTPSNLP